ncbi:cytochrome D1 domain-containing protein [Pelomicrobium sp.]|mgnify:CR=1 FL=1|jgi:mono/diheme cytochrome c family protein/DNA-binding beta-propeller fold protein YncE|uniref:cytochrome D1 domain-containing protein n=1 Tax=Pelomicrobium sp. TaxID=2815319 RepID=UPI002FDE1468
MHRAPALAFATLVLSWLCAAPSQSAQDDSAELYRRHCAACHGAERLGGKGPALLPENLSRLPKGEAERVIAQGRAATHMPGFAGTLTALEIARLADYVYAPPRVQPVWGENEIDASRIVHRPPQSLPPAPVHRADPLNLFVVVETGDHHATILDGDRFEPIVRFSTRFALHGGPKFSPDGRFVYFASRDGWISKYDLYGLSWVAEVRAGINTRNLALSSDGRYVMVANYLPHTLVVLDAQDLRLLKVIPVQDGKGRSSRVSAVYDAAPRRSFVAALKDLKQIWEIPYAENTAAVYRGLVHDYRMGEALAEQEPFPVRVTELDDYLDDFFFDPSYAYVIGASRDGSRAQVVNLDVRRKIADLDLPGLPHLGSGIAWTRAGRPVLATPNLKQALVSVIDMGSWKVVKQIETLGPGFFLRSHEGTRYAWVDVFFGPHRDALHVIDKESLEIVATLRPAPGKTAAHVEFTRDGGYALVSVWENDGALVVYDAERLQEVKRLPMNKPSGKYNVYNKITRSTGTSH